MSACNKESYIKTIAACEFTNAGAGTRDVSRCGRTLVVGAEDLLTPSDLARQEGAREIPGRAFHNHFEGAGHLRKIDTGRGGSIAPVPDF